MPSGRCSFESGSRVDELFDTLSHRLRREVIDYFEEHAEGDAATLDELVVHIEQRVPRSVPDTLETQLRHVHLPKLGERGWLEFDRRTGHVRYEGHAEAAAWLGEVGRRLG